VLAHQPAPANLTRSATCSLKTTLPYALGDFDHHLQCHAAAAGLIGIESLTTTQVRWLIDEHTRQILLAQTDFVIYFVGLENTMLDMHDMEIPLEPPLPHIRVQEKTGGPVGILFRPTQDAINPQFQQDRDASLKLWQSLYKSRKFWCHFYMRVCIGSFVVGSLFQEGLTANTKRMTFSSIDCVLCLHAQNCTISRTLLGLQ
jgi:hypothetical protein